MSNGTTKIRLKIGGLEIEYEGKESFLQDELFNTVKKALTLYAENKELIPAEPAAQAGAGRAAPLGGFDHSTNTIAAHLGVSTGSDLVIAAAAHLALVKGKDKFTRKEINDEMKGATTYYKTSMSANLSKSLETLVKGKRLNQVAMNNYSLSASERQSLEAKLAGQH
ncbi:MAG: hypothetical protein FVQ81_09715 [Candidatus Glassbacteria bacterium]|nr:hypothetical protein [Candidatus Glassbacteria bacterium]